MSLRNTLALCLVIAATASWPGRVAAGDALAIVDTHVHYNADAWSVLPPGKAVAALRAAGLRKAFVSSTSDDGTRRLHAIAPDLVVPVLRPYREPGDDGTWLRDESVIDYLEARLATGDYAGLGEFHVFGADADRPVMRRVVALAREHDLFLHAHADLDAMQRLYAQDPAARVLWAHCGFIDPDLIRPMLERHEALWCDLSFRDDAFADGALTPDWQTLVEAFPTRFTLGSDPYTPERWFYVGDYADWSREWLAALPTTLAERIAHRNAAALLEARR